MKKVLVTGFEPFGEESINPSLVAIKKLGKMTFPDILITIRHIPVVFQKSLQVLVEMIEEMKPDIVICVGQAGGRNNISLERIAINVDDARIPDNEQNQPIDLPVIPDGPVGYFSTLPIKAIVKNIKDAGIPASVSNTAGTYVCNHLFYGLQHLIATKYPRMRGGFIHIPYLPEQVIEKSLQPSMNITDIVKGLEIAIYTSVNQKDITIGGGEIY